MKQNENKLIRDLASDIGIFRYLSYRDFLGELYKRVKIQIPNYSYLKFADALGFSETNVIRLIIIGKRTLTSKSAKKITSALGFKADIRLYWEHLIEYNNARLPEERDKHFSALMKYKNKVTPESLDDEQVEYFSEWQNVIIREMMNLSGIDGEPEAIKEALLFPLRLDQIKNSVDTLKKINAIEYDDTANKYKLSKQNISVDSGVDSLAITKYHQNMIDLGKQALTRVDDELREVGAVTVSLPISSVPIIKGKIDELLQYMLTLEEASSSTDEVFQLNIQFFPFTNKSKNKK